MWQRTDLAQVKRDRHTSKPRKTRNTKAFRLRQSISSAEIRRKRLSLPTGEVRPSEHNYDYAAGSHMDEPGVRQAVWPRHGRGAGGLHPRPVSGSLRRPAYPRVLPHGYRCGGACAAEKYTSLVSGGMTPLDAHFTVSRLLGHERPDVTNIYLTSVKGGAARGE